MRRILILGLLLFLPIMVAVPVHAEFNGDVLAPVCDIESGSSACQSKDEDGNFTNPISGQDGAIMRVVNIMSWVTGFAAIIIGIYAGLKYVLANGDSNSITTARNALLYALIGVVLFAASRVIIMFVVGQV